MEREIVRGSKELSKILGVTDKTIFNWKKAGILADAVLSDFNRVIIYDLKKVFECLNHKAVKPGRKPGRRVAV